MPVEQLELRRGEVVIDCMNSIEDTKGNNGESGEMQVPPVRKAAAYKGASHTAGYNGTYGQTRVTFRYHPGGNPGANLKSISHRCHPILVAFV